MPVALAAALLSGCASDSLKQAPASPDAPWAPEGTTATPGTFAIPPNPEIGGPSAGVQTGGTYDLPKLIDLAQRSNPATRVAWEQARQAALAQGMIEATFLPVITANVIGGYQEVTTPVRTLDGGTDYITTSANGVAPNIALQWLVFDFGQRQAWREAAGHTAYAANVAFNGTHQTLIYDVSRTYFAYGAVEKDLAIARTALANSRRIQEAADARLQNGIGTTIETAQARQAVAEANLHVVQTEDLARDAYQDLLGAVGISPRSNIKVSSSAGRRLPAPRALPTDDIIEAALARRPDVLASFAALKATEANARAADADFMPKAYVGAIAGMNNVNLQSGNLPQVGLQGTTPGVLVGLSVPLYEGGLRQARQKQAQSTVAEAEAMFEQSRNAATREIVVSSDALRSSLEAYSAATTLTDAARLTYEAAFAAYENGVGTITDATAAENGLLAAEEARADAHAAALISASTLAFSLGALTSSAAASAATGQ